MSHAIAVSHAPREDSSTKVALLQVLTEDSSTVVELTSTQPVHTVAKDSSPSVVTPSHVHTEDGSKAEPKLKQKSKQQAHTVAEDSSTAELKPKQKSKQQVHTVAEDGSAAEPKPKRTPAAKKPAVVAKTAPRKPRKPRVPHTQ